MRYVMIDRSQEGMVLAKSIFDGSGCVLLGSRTVLTEEYIQRLAARGLAGFYVLDELTDDIQIDEVITEQLRNDGVQALKRHNIDATLDVAKKIVEQISNSSTVSLDLIDLRTFDDYTYRHSVNVAVISTIIGMNMSMNQGMLQELCIAAMLHDIGKLLIDPGILNKPGKLTLEEYSMVKQHSTFAYEILQKRMDISSTIRSGVLSHHENEDGTGYPNGLKDKQISKYAKIIHVSDVFDALTSKRPYKMPYARSEAVEYLMGSCSRLFDTSVVRAFLKSVPIYPKGTSVLLSTGQEAVVIENTRNTLRPKVRLLDGQEINLGSLDEYRNITIISTAASLVS
jgi:HD-GYP domain-containing protein (c-di-GMP phosphodiesterase class II)